MSDFLRPFNILTLLIGIAGLFFGYYFFRASQPTVRIHYVEFNEMIARLDRKDLGLTKDGQVLETRHLYKSFVAIWNAGNVPIEIGSVRRTFTVEFASGNKVIDAEIKKVSHNVSEFSRKISDNKIEIDWKYFDPGFYLILEVYHTNADPTQVSLRYIGDQNIVLEVPKSLGVGYYLVLVPFILVIIAIAAFLDVTLELYFERRTGRSAARLLGKEVSYNAIGNSVLFSIGILLALILLPDNRFERITRAIFDFRVPAEISEYIRLNPIIGSNNGAS